MHQFVLEKQDCISQCEKYQNGDLKKIFVVAKNLPFCLHITSPSGGFEQAVISTQLFFDDGDSCSKEVQGVKSTPLRSVVHIHDDKTLSIENRLGVLSTQYEGSFFRILVTITQKSSRDSYQVLSGAIKVTSKRRQAEAASDNFQQRLNVIKKGAITDRTTVHNASSDAVLQAVARVEELQRNQQRMMDRFFEQQQYQPASNATKRVKIELDAKPPMPEIKIEPSSMDKEFEFAFASFFNLFQQMPPETRVAHLQNLMSKYRVSALNKQQMAQNSLHANTDLNTGFLDMISQHDIPVDSGADSHTQQKCTDNHNVDLFEDLQLHDLQLDNNSEFIAPTGITFYNN